MQNFHETSSFGIWYHHVKECMKHKNNVFLSLSHAVCCINVAIILGTVTTLHHNDYTYYAYNTMHSRSHRGLDYRVRD